MKSKNCLNLQFTCKYIRYMVHPPFPQISPVHGSSTISFTFLLFSNVIFLFKVSLKAQMILYGSLLHPTYISSHGPIVSLSKFKEKRNQLVNMNAGVQSILLNSQGNMKLMHESNQKQRQSIDRV